MLKPLIHFEFVFIKKRFCKGDTSTCGDQVFSASFVEEAVFSPMYAFDTSVKNQMTLDVRSYFCVLCSVPLVYIVVFMPMPCCFLLLWFHSMLLCLQNCLFLLMIALATQGFFILSDEF
jgi:hypothetical protein